MVSYACASSQSELGKYFEWIRRHLICPPPPPLPPQKKNWGGQIRCIIGDVPAAYEAGYKLHSNTMTYDKIINSPFVHEVQLSKKCVIFDALRTNVLRIIGMCNQTVTSGNYSLISRVYHLSWVTNYVNNPGFLTCLSWIVSIKSSILSNVRA